MEPALVSEGTLPVAVVVQAQDLIRLHGLSGGIVSTGVAGSECGLSSGASDVCALGGAPASVGLAWPAGATPNNCCYRSG